MQLKKKFSKKLQELDYLLTSSNQFFSDLLGYKPEKTILQILNNKQWNAYFSKIGANTNSLGIYLPRNQTATIYIESKTAPMNLFHEYFGHGFFCEQSLIGKRLVDLEKSLLEEEETEFSGKKFTLRNLYDFRQHNKVFKVLSEFRKENLKVYEGFAVFIEFILSRENNLQKIFEIKYLSSSSTYKEQVNEIINFNQLYGDLSTFYSYGLKKILDKKRLLHLSNDIFTNKFKNIKLLLHFGSKKPFSDIDIFVVSKSITSMHSTWIDVRARNYDEIKFGIKLLDPKITDPIMVGDLIYGDKYYLKKIKNEISIQPISEEAIKYNLEKSLFHKNRSKDPSLGIYLQEKNLRSSKTYLANANALQKGKKILTFSGLTNFAINNL